MWEQSLIIRLLTVLVAGAGNSGYAISYCSSSFRFDHLCPDPRFGSREAGTTGGGSSISSSTNHLNTDTCINLSTDNSLHRRGCGGGSYPASSTYGGKSYTSSMCVKDPSTKRCDFHRNGEENAVVTAIHVTENPWTFRHANPCHNIVKFNYESLDADDGIRGQGTAGVSVICQNEEGFRRKGSQNEEQSQAEKKKQTDREEAGKKMNVYFWHNFTFYPHSAEYVDTISNYHWSKDDISCVDEKQRAQYVQIEIVIFKNAQCETIVQQYKIGSTKRSPWSCSGTGYPIPYPNRFCGSYDCSQNNGILTNSKLIPRRDIPHFDSDQKPVWNNEGSSRLPGEKLPTSSQMETQQPHHHHHHHDDDSSEGSNVACTDKEDGGSVTEMVETTPSSQPQQHSAPSGEPTDPEEEVEKEKPTDWMEALFLILFPTLGIVSIVGVLMFLRSRSAREICRGYSYPRPHEPQHMYIPGSFNSIDKSTLPI